MTEFHLPAGRPEELGLCPERLARIGSVLRREIESGRLPGAVAMVARRGRIAWHGAFGVRAPATGVPMTADSIFRIYSMTKPIVSVAAMMLLEEGRVQLTDPIAHHLPEFADPQVARIDDGRLVRVPAARAPTVQDLLRHTAGFTYEFIEPGPLGDLYRQAALPDPSRSTEAFCAVLAKLPLACSPGERWRYSRATDVLGRLVEVASGVRLGAFLAERIFAPLGMRDTGFHVPPEHHGRIAEPFPTDPDTGEKVRLLDPRSAPRFESGGGGLMSTLADYARFTQMLANGGELDGVRLLARPTVELMTTDHLGDLPVDPTLIAPGYGFGLGFTVRRAAGMAPSPGSIGQYSWGGIAGTTFWVDPREELIGLFMSQAPGQRDYYRPLFRNLVYAAIVDRR